MTGEPIGGLIAPILTPFNDDLSVATDLYVEHAHRLLDEGCAGLAPFGTTGEALSLTMAERTANLVALVVSGIDPRLLVPGTGLTNLPDTIELSAHAMELGCRAAMTLPPFYIKAPPDDGVLDYFGRLVAAVGPEIRIFLYHIPQVAGVGFGPALVARLKLQHPDQVVAIKDSSGDWDNTKKLFDIDGLSVYPGSEIPVLEALEFGSPGCISATANLGAAAIIRSMYLHAIGDELAREHHDSVVARRRVFESYAPIPAQKYLLARTTGDERWRTVRPPLRSLRDEDGERLTTALAALRP